MNLFACLLKIYLVYACLISVCCAATFGAKDFNLLKYVNFYITNDYVDSKVDHKKLEYGAIKGYLSALGDPYTRFLEPKNYKEMQVRMQCEFSGIGIHIGMRKDVLTVISPIKGTPADKAGLQSLDMIISIDGEDVPGISLNEAVSKIRGPRGTTVTLGIRRKGVKEVIEVPIVRDNIKLRAVDKVDVLPRKLGDVETPYDIGYVRLTTFESHKATKEIISGIKELEDQDIKGLILDLRYNGGGLLSNAISIASLFIEKGDVVHTIDRDGKKKTESVLGGVIYPDKPLIVMINEGSASASEILAGAIKDNKRGLVVGKDSFGKASVQKILKLQDGAAVLYTIAKYFTPKMTDITKKGISVDIELAIPTENMTLYKSKDFVYQYETDYQLERAVSEMIKIIEKEPVTVSSMR